MKFPLILAFAAATLFAAACSEPLNEVAEEATPQNEAVETPNKPVYAWSVDIIDIKLFF